MNGDDQAQRMLRVLEEMRDNQKLQLERQAEALAAQRETLALVERQTERAERLQDRAEQIQEKSAKMVAAGRTVMAIVLPLVIVLIAYLSWLLFARPWR
ncbi:MAG TPA: hypothetical protein VFB01_14080 [Burkholderiales bacterium]|nr:hypothetical protein [Burkholderiales bacterium]